MVTPTYPTAELTQAINDACYWTNCNHDHSPTNLEPLTKWAVVVTNEISPSRGVAWNADVYYAGMKAFTASNSGNGGDNKYQYAPNTPEEASYLMFKIDAQAAYPTVTYEVEDNAIAFLDQIHCHQIAMNKAARKRKVK